MRKLIAFIFWDKYYTNPSDWPNGLTYLTFPKFFRLKHRPNSGDELSYYDKKLDEWFYFRITNIDINVFSYKDKDMGSCTLNIENI